ncbi:GGDEF domain-containing protein [Kaistia algarum]|uniref:GGDEF domain-containing protein n=1 Tax=Kaistia algarum TaxID=2083279 RepID=UPI000CE83EC6|nr:GGDEF domain-containing protein [Kaistia algarum]MCX5516041.1 GGDEF domain-containing protein [Kaistia algarum]PPE77968.1 GGDEF domain-containing protein [Kaistia algarum]
MSLDYNSLLLSVGFSAAGLAIAILGGWLLVRTERFMLTWAIGLAFLVGQVASYSYYVHRPTVVGATASMVLLLLGFSTLYGAAVQFVCFRSPIAPFARAAIPSILSVAIPMAFGLDGIGFFTANFAAGLIFCATAAQYWRGRREARVPLIGVSILYGVVAASFFLCAAVIAMDGKAILSGPPANWAEDLSLIVALVGMTGIGALSLALNQWRLAARHRQDALTDSLTGLLNRRALFEAYGERPLPVGTTVVVFDLDHFKSINDRHGHAVGDAVLRRFAATLATVIRPGDRAARIGGEEFALVLPETPQPIAVQIAELVRHGFEAARFAGDSETIRCTVSAGLAVADEDADSFESTLTAADRAL